MGKARLASLIMAAAFVAVLGAQGMGSGGPQKEEPVKIIIRVGNKKVTATMEDSPAARDFLALLPITLTLSDYAGTEKVGDLPKKLSTDSAPRGIDPSVGDLTYYAPWGNLALFYRDFGYASGLVLLGRLDSGIELFKVGGSLQATFEIQ